jgi:hypothetical protein
MLLYLKKACFSDAQSVFEDQAFLLICVRAILPIA